MKQTYVPALTGNSRVFITEGRARPDHEPVYMGCMVAGGPSQSFGDVTTLECPSPDQYGRWDVVAEVPSGSEPATISLTGRYALDVESDLLRIAKRECQADVRVQFGECTDPSDKNHFTKALYFEVARLTNWSSDDMGALGRDDNAGINESVDVSAREMYEVLPLQVTERGADVVLNPLEDVVICSKPECGTCDDEDEGCEVIFAVGDSSPGSPGTAPDLIWSNDGGDSVNSDDINSLDAAEDADALACVSEYVVVVSNEDGGIHYKTKADIIAGVADSWTRVATNIAVGGEPNDIWSVGNFAFVVGDTGYVYGLSNVPLGVVELDAGVATTQNLYAVHALDKLFAVAVGASNAIIYTKSQDAWESITGPTDGAGDTNQAVWVKNKREWWIGNDAGEVYYTLDEGDNWTAVTFPVTFTSIEDIQFATESIGYIAGVVAGPAAVVLRTFDGGYSWIAIPEGVGSLPAADRIDAIAACQYDPNFVALVGLADDASDGFFAIAED